MAARFKTSPLNWYTPQGKNLNNTGKYNSITVKSGALSKRVRINRFNAMTAVACDIFILLYNNNKNNNMNVYTIKFLDRKHRCLYFLWDFSRMNKCLDSYGYEHEAYRCGCRERDKLHGNRERKKDGGWIEKAKRYNIQYYSGDGGQ